MKINGINYDLKRTYLLQLIVFFYMNATYTVNDINILSLFHLYIYA